MKVINNILRIFSVLFSVTALALFFVNFATFTATGTTYTFNAAQFAWGGAEVITAKSAQLAFCMILTILTLVSSVLAFIKRGGWRYASSAFGIVAGIYMLVVALSSPYKFIDLRPLAGVTGLSYTVIAPLIAVAILLATAASIGYLFTSDYLKVQERGGVLLGKKIIKFLRDYRGEVKKIVWPGPKAVVKNTLIVLIMSVLVGIFIWIIDFSLGQLINLILGVN